MISKYTELLSKSTLEITQDESGNVLFRIQQEFDGQRHASTYILTRREVRLAPEVFEYALERFLWKFERYMENFENN